METTSLMWTSKKSHNKLNIRNNIKIKEVNLKMKMNANMDVNTTLKEEVKDVQQFNQEVFKTKKNKWRYFMIKKKIKN